MSDLKDYFNTHPCLNLSAVEKAAGVPAKSLRRFLSGVRDLSVEHEKKLMVVVVEYGFGPKLGQEKKSGPKVGQAAPSKAKARPKIGPKKKKPSTEIFNACKESFNAWYLERKDMEYDFTAACAGSLSSIIRKLTTKAEQKGAEGTPEEILNGFNFVLERVDANNWILENADLKLINSKFNQLIAKQNGKSTSLPTVDDIKAEVARRSAARANANS